MIAFRRFKGSSPRLSVTLQIGERGTARRGRVFRSEVEGEAKPLLMVGGGRARRRDYVGARRSFHVSAAAGRGGPTEPRSESSQLASVAF